MNLDKYSRQVLFHPIGEAGQKRLRAAKAVIIGCGALGTAQANAMVRAGVGALRIVDRDYVEESNLQCLSLFEENDARESLPKAIAAERKLNQINSDVLTEGVIADATSRNIEGLGRGFDVILAGTENFEPRYLLNDASVKLGIPWIYGAVVASSAVTMTILPGQGPCLSCVIPHPPAGLHETCDTVGVIGPAAAWASAIQVTEALKILLGHEQHLHRTLLGFDIWLNRTHTGRPQRHHDC